MNLPPGAVEDDGMVAEPVAGAWIAYHAMTAGMIHQTDRDALAWGRGPTAEAALADARRRGCREIEDPGSSAYIRRLTGIRKWGCPAPGPRGLISSAGR